jgi:hypothetical protein
MDSKRIDTEILGKQEIIYSFFSEIVEQYPPKEVLKEFKGLFFDYYSFIENQQAITAIYDLTFGRHERAFSETLKQCCYILIRNWLEKQKYFYINELIKSFQNLKKKTSFINTMMNRRDTWLENFINSQAYLELQSFIYQDKNVDKIWLPVYNYYPLIVQSLNQNYQKQQREAAEILATKLKNDFKFQLSRYLGDVEANLDENMRRENPTHLGEQLIHLLKTLVLRRDKLNYANLAQIFLHQTMGLTYAKFKNSFHTYIMFSLEKNVVIEVFRQKSFIFIDSYTATENNEVINEELINKTCNNFLENLTIDNEQEPSELFNLFVLKVNPLVLTIILLKIILLSPKSRETLEKNLVTLINYYKKKNNQESQWFINFLDIYNVTTCIYADISVQVYIKDNELIYLVS